MSPVYFPHLDPQTGELVDVEYFSTREVAERLHMSASTVRRRTSAGIWPHLRVFHHVYMNAEQIARAVELMTVDGPKPIETDPS